MSKDSGATRIPRLDGISRIPPPGSFGGATTMSTAGSAANSHIRPPTVLKSTTQIFRAPALPGNANTNAHPKARPISSYHPAAAPLHDLGASIKKSASGQRLNNAVSVISKRTTNVLNKYFGPGKMFAGSGANGVAAAACSSLPQTPLPAAKQQVQQQQQQRQPQSLLVSSTPMPLMRSETFVCGEEKQQQQQQQQQREQQRGQPRGVQREQQLEETPAANRTRLEHTRLSSVGFGRTLDMDAASMTMSENSSLGRNRVAPLDKEPLDFDRNATRTMSPRMRTVILSSNETRDGNLSSAQPDRTRTIASAEAADATQLLGSSRADRIAGETVEPQVSVTQLLGSLSASRSDRTRPVIPNDTTEPQEVTQLLGSLSSSRSDRTRPVIPNDTTEPQDVTQLLGSLSSSRADRTRPVITAAGEVADATQFLGKQSSTRPDCLRPLYDLDATLTHNLSLDLTKSMDQLPLLEHVSIPSGLDLLSGVKSELPSEADALDSSDPDVTLTALAPNKSSMKLPLNSTINTERLLDISGLQSPARHIQLLNLTRELLEQSPQQLATHSGRRSVAQHSLVCLTPQSASSSTTATSLLSGRFQQTPVPVHLLSPLLKAARSDLVLPTRTPEGELLPLPLPLDGSLAGVQLRTPRTRFSFGLDLQETSLNDSIELVENSMSSSQQQLQQLQQQLLKKQHSFDLDESLGILTPDQMNELLDSPSQHNTNNNNNTSASLSHQLELHLVAQQQHFQQQQQLQLQKQQQLQQQLRMEQTPSPEELPLDPIEPQLVAAITTPAPASSVVVSAGAGVAAASAAPAKLSNSFITSVTSVTSLDTGYQGDGEMSRPASRGACDHSPSNGPQLGRVSRQPSFPPMPAAAAPLRRQDPMTDSDFFTESDADDVLQRGDRRAQVIDGQLYGPAMQPSASVPQLEDSCMESSGIFTDVENRCDEEMRLPELEVDMEIDMSPDDSTQTLRKAQGQAQQHQHQQQQQQQQQQLVQPRSLSSSSAATTLSNRTSYCSVDGGSAKSFCDDAFAKSFCDEAFNASSTSTSTSSGSASGSELQQRSSVQRGSSPRPHASLTSLCTVENLHSTSPHSSSSSLASPKSSCKIAKTTKAAAAAAAAATATATATATAATSNRKLKSPQTPRSSKTPVARKAHTPNKWDAVMHKIASNKSTIKTNYNDVKSKVSTTRSMAGSGQSPTAPRSPSSGSGGSPRISPTVRRSPSATPAIVKRATSTPASTSTRQPKDKGSVAVGSGAGASASVNVFARLAKSQSPTSPTAPAAKRLQPAMVKRGRSYSKDSQKSSHSDLSSLCNGNVSGSPKQLAKTPLRAAKKRDVRNLSISPTDLGPPPKTQQTAKGQSTRTKSLTPTPPAIQKRSNVNSGTTTTNTSASPIKHNGKIVQLKCVKKSPGNATNTNNIKNGSKASPAGITEESLRSGVDQTELQELGLGLLLTSSSKRASLGNELACCLCGTIPSSSSGGSGSGCGCAAKKAPKLQCYGSHAPEPTNAAEPAELEQQQQQQQQQQKQLELELEPQPVEQHESEFKPLGMATTNEEFSDNTSTVTLQSKEDNPADYPSLKRFMANGLLQYECLAKFVDTTSGWQQQSDCQTLGLAVVVQFMAEQMDTLSSQEMAAKSSLSETIALLQKTQQSCEEMRLQLQEKDLEWTQRQQEREHLQRSELQQAQDKVQEVQMLAKERFRELESQLLAKDEEKKQALQTYHEEIAHQLRHKQQQLAAAEQQVLQLQTRLQEQESRQQELREQLTVKENMHANRLAECAEREEELQKRIKSLTKELQTLRASTEHKERDLRGRLALSEDEISVLRNSSQQRSPSSSLNDSNADLWQREAESLRYVLDMKQDKIADLSKENAELKREAEEQRGLNSRLTMLEAQNEMLRTELEAKTEKEKDIQRQMEEMQKAFNHESIKRKRLTCDKEELQYHLKQRSEQLQLLQAQLHEQLFNSSQDSPLNQSYNSARFSMEALHSAPHSSPPPSPVIKGVIERNDSVSWVLEMDDETPQVAASKMVRRAGSLRSASERSPTQRRQLSQSANAASIAHGQNGHSNGPNPLSQSMSATTLLRNHSEESPVSPQPLTRACSQSVCTKAMVATPTSQRQQPNSEATGLPVWHSDELCSSSPQSASASASARVELRPRSSSAAMKLMSSMDVYPKSMKKFQEVQESAGEAMVSGANSEDESCSASSEDMRSSSASSTASAAGCTLSKRPKQPSRMSIEEALMIEPINSLNGTPMEVSWSEDAADADAAGAHQLA